MKVLRPFVWAAVLVAAFCMSLRWPIGMSGRVLRPVRQHRTPVERARIGRNRRWLSADEQNNIDIYKRARRHGEYHLAWSIARPGFPRSIRKRAPAPGLLISPDGEILTNHHVVSGGSAQLTVTLSDKKVYKAKVLVARSARRPGADQDRSRNANCPPCGWAIPTITVVGQKVLAIGNPFGFEGTLTTGIVSSLGRTIQTEESRDAGRYDPDRRRHQSRQ